MDSSSPLAGESATARRSAPVAARGWCSRTTSPRPFQARADSGARPTASVQSPRVDQARTRATAPASPPPPRPRRPTPAEHARAGSRPPEQPSEGRPEADGRARPGEVERAIRHHAARATTVWVGTSATSAQPTANEAVGSRAAGPRPCRPRRPGARRPAPGTPAVPGGVDDGERRGPDPERQLRGQRGGARRGRRAAVRLQRPAGERPVAGEDEPQQEARSHRGGEQRALPRWPLRRIHRLASQASSGRTSATSLESAARTSSAIESAVQRRRPRGSPACTVPRCAGRMIPPARPSAPSTGRSHRPPPWRVRGWRIRPPRRGMPRGAEPSDGDRPHPEGGEGEEREVPGQEQIRTMAVQRLLDEKVSRRKGRMRQSPSSPRGPTRSSSWNVPPATVPQTARQSAPSASGARRRPASPVCSMRARALSPLRQPAPDPATRTGLQQVTPDSEAKRTAAALSAPGTDAAAARRRSGSRPRRGGPGPPPS